VSNLSELLPAGGGGKNVKFVANGILPNGQAVVLKSNGQVEAVGISSVSQSIPAGSEYVFNTGSRARNPIIAFDPNTAGKFVVVFKDIGNSSYSTALVASVSGTTISFGSETVFYSGAMGLSDIEFDPNTAGKFIIAYRDESNSVGRAIVGTVSGTSVSFGTAVTFESADVNSISMSFDPNTSGKFAIAYLDIGNSDRGTMIIGTRSGTSVSFGSPVIFNTDSSTTHSVCYDPLNAGKLAVTYNRGTLRARVGTVSGTTPSFGTEVVFSSENNNTHLATAIDNITGKTLSVYYTDGYAKAIVGTISGTSISFATAVNWKNSLTYYMTIAADPLNTGNFIVNYSDGANSNYAKTVVCTVSGTTPSFGSPTLIVNSNMGSYVYSKFDPNTSGKFVTTYEDAGNSDYGTSAVGQTAVQVTNLTSTNFLGISDAAVASGAAGKVTIKGGLKTELAGGTFAVTVANPGSGNRYYINGVLQYTLNLREGFTYKFDQSASSNSNHPFRFSTTSNGSHASGSEYTTGVTTSGTPGNAGAYTQIVVAASAPTLYYYCTNHSGMGGTANTLAAIVPNSVYYVQGDGTLSTTTTSPAVRIGKALSSTSINLEFNS